MSQKKNGFANILLIVLVVVLVGALGYVALVKKPTTDITLVPTGSPTVQATPVNTMVAITSPAPLSTSCKDETEGTPVITSLSVYSGPVGTKLDIKGCNFLGFEGDKNAWIQNNQGEKGLLRGARDNNSKVINVTLSSPLCTGDTSYSGLPCPKYITLTSGNYKIFVDPWGKKSNEASFTITNETTSVKVYFHNSKTQQANSCNEVAVVTRIIPKTEKIATAAISELLKGPSSQEKINGYLTNIPTGSNLNSLIIVDGEARADFNAITESGGGSCSMAMRTTQIRETLLQFATIKSVKISIDGRTADIFQP